MGRQLTEPISRCRPEQLGAVVDRAVAVPVQGQESAPGSYEVDLIVLAVAVDVEPVLPLCQLRGVAAVVDDQGILRGGAHLDGQAFLAHELAAHGELDVDGDFLAICRPHNAFGREAG